jgi:hypothetical protein
MTVPLDSQIYALCNYSWASSFCAVVESRLFMYTNLQSKIPVALLLLVESKRFPCTYSTIRCHCNLRSSEALHVECTSGLHSCLMRMGPRAPCPIQVVFSNSSVSVEPFHYNDRAPNYIPNFDLPMTRLQLGEACNLSYRYYSV